MQNKYEIFSHERKRLQRIGEAPDWYTTAGFQLLSEQGYFMPGETPKGMYTRVATRAAELTTFSIPTEYGYPNWKDAFLDIILKGHLCPATPVLSNLGTTRGQSVSCSGSDVMDSIKGIYATKMELALLTKEGYGTSVNLDNIRPRGASIATGGESSGVMPVIDGIVSDMGYVSQGTRRGSCGIYISPLHGDFFELCDRLLNDNEGLNVGWIITDEFDELFAKDEERASAIWNKLLKVKMLTGKGYFFFADKANRASPEVYKRLGLTIKASNLCVTGDTKVLTKHGHIPIEQLAGTSQECWNGKSWETTELVQTSEGQPVLTVKLDNLTTIEATPYHKWYIQESYHGKPVEKRTSELQPGDKLIKFDLEPVTHGTKVLNLAYTNGFHSGDGTVYKDRNAARISLHDGKQTLVSRISGYHNSSYSKEGRILNLMFKPGVLRAKFFIPSTEYSVQSRLNWLEGYLDADGTLTNNNGTESIQVASVEPDFLKELLLLLQELGIHSTISKMRDEGYRMMPRNDGSGDLYEVWTQDVYRLLIAGSSLSRLLDLGYDASRVIPTRRHYQREARQFTKVLSVTDEGKVVPTYCGSEKTEHKLMFNGVLTGNCNEIRLFSDKDHSFTCVLSSMNAAKYDEWKDTCAVQIAIVFLDAVCSDMLLKSRGKEGLEKIVRFTEKSRALGLGTLGISTYYQQQSWEFGDFQSIQFNQSYFRSLRNKAEEASRLVATHNGEPEFMLGTGRAHTHLIAIAPTMSNATISGGVSLGINPVFANVYEQDTAGGTVYRINPPLLKLMKLYNTYNVETMKRIAEDQGSVQAEDWLTDHEKSVFRTAFEVNQETVLLMASQRQPSIDQGQSLNLYFTAEETEEEISRIHHIAFKDELIHGLYYVRSLSGTAKVVVDKSECLVCDG